MPSAAIAVTATGTLVAAVSGKRIRVHGLHIQRLESSSETVKFASYNGSTATDITGVLPYSFTLPYNPEGWFETILGESLRIILSGTVTVGGHVHYSVAN